MGAPSGYSLLQCGMPGRNGSTSARARRPTVCETLARAAQAECMLADLAMARGDWDAAASCEEQAALSEHLAGLLEEGGVDGRGWP
jgi:hypothetical protein